MNKQRVEEIVADAFDRIGPISFTETGVNALKKAIHDDLIKHFGGEVDALLEEFTTVRRICKPHRWLGFGDSTCIDCERQGIDLTKAA